MSVKAVYSPAGVFWFKRMCFPFKSPVFNYLPSRRETVSLGPSKLRRQLWRQRDGDLGNLSRELVWVYSPFRAGNSSIRRNDTTVVCHLGILVLLRELMAAHHWATRGRTAMCRPTIPCVPLNALWRFIIRRTGSDTEYFTTDGAVTQISENKHKQIHGKELSLPRPQREYTLCVNYIQRWYRSPCRSAQNALCSSTPKLNVTKIRCFSLLRLLWALISSNN